MDLFKKLSILLCLFFFSAQTVHSQVSPVDAFVEEDDLNIGGDIFNDFNEDVEAAQVLEDERFYRYGRFFSFQVGLGLTSFDGNRGNAYENDPPTFNLGLNYFLDFASSFGMGFDFSKHHIFIDFPTLAFADPVGLIDVSMFRVYFAYRYYIDTSNLGTAITYANPYFVGRMEYWYVTNKFRDQTNLGDDNGGGLGFGFGFGGEFPIKLKESYIGVEFVFHTVNFHDKFTQNYKAPLSNPDGPGFDDLSGNAYSTVISYVINW
ncbi:MAG: hypothetical protein HN509_08455 [Halobacteriovoraceae bacterium]|jgi:hypothetical protein|nr:hypothetical protein [Halobacteriovoraceae bacterium]